MPQSQSQRRSHRWLRGSGAVRIAAAGGRHLRLVVLRHVVDGRHSGRARGDDGRVEDHAELRAAWASRRGAGGPDQGWCVQR
eukprot:7175374-Prymnesium_polylepis.1